MSGFRFLLNPDLLHFPNKINYDHGLGPLTVGGPGSLNLLNPLLLRHWSRGEDVRRKKSKNLALVTVDSVRIRIRRRRGDFYHRRTSSTNDFTGTSEGRRWQRFSTSGGKQERSARNGTKAENKPPRQTNSYTCRTERISLRTIRRLWAERYCWRSIIKSTLGRIVRNIPTLTLSRIQGIKVRREGN